MASMSRARISMDSSLVLVVLGLAVLVLQVSQVGQMILLAFIVELVSIKRSVVLVCCVHGCDDRVTITDAARLGQPVAERIDAVGEAGGAVVVRINLTPLSDG